MKRSSWFILAAVVAAGVGGLLAYHFSGPNYPPERVAAWKSVTPRVEQARDDAAAAADPCCARVREFFKERRGKARAFAEEALSLKGKWFFVKDYLPFTESGGHRRFLNERFEATVFSSSELDALLRSVIEEYVGKVDGIENELLVGVGADLADGALEEWRSGGRLAVADAFRAEFTQAVEAAAGTVGKDLAVQAGREVVAWVGADIAAAVAVSLAASLGEELGISAGILGTGAASSAATLGTGLVAAFIIDALLNKLLVACGYDAVGDAAGKVEKGLVEFETLLIDGTPASKGKPGKPGLRGQLRQLSQKRAQAREAALKKLILEGGTP